jgi:hypothetical protein
MYDTYQQPGYDAQKRPQWLVNDKKDVMNYVKIGKN